MTQHTSSLRVGLVYEASLRPETTGFYCLRALQSLVDVAHISPEQLATVSADDFDLFVQIDDGLDYPWPQHLQPAVFWAIDTHLNPERVLQKAPAFQQVFVAQKPGVELLQQEGIEATWLPLACDAEIHHPLEREKIHDVSFVGNPLSGKRKQLLERLEERASSLFVGQRYFEQMAETYAESRIGWNCAINDDLNMRVFEALGCGVLLLTDQLTETTGWQELFTPGEHFLTYDSEAQLFEQIDWALAHPEECARIAQQGHELVLASHTYQHRMETLLAETEHLLHSSSVSHSTIAPALKGPGYFGHTRPEVLELIPTSAKRVLDLGCGSGQLGATLKARQSVEVIGVELDSRAAAVAEEHLDEVVQQNLEDDSLPWKPESFDVVVCADLLEHIREPAQLLNKIREWLKPEGTLVLSLPNVQHYSVINALLSGNWTYEAAGLLDEDHVRFFTRRELEKLLFQAGFAVTQLQPKILPQDERLWEETAQPGSSIGGLALSAMSSDQRKAFFTYQYLVTAQPAPEPNYGLTSIIIATHNQWAFTQQCLESLQRRTIAPYEVIVVDNGSTDETVKMLQQWEGVTLITNEENRGFPAAVNQGLAVAQGEQILLLNNDVILTTGWLERLLEVLWSDEAIGLVGPCSNNVSGLQQIPVSYRSLTELDGFGWDRRHTHQGETTVTDRLVGFCLLFKREVHQRVGAFDEQFGIGCYEDDDYCRRARVAGFQSVVVWDSFVHHFGSQTFRNSEVDFSALLEENQQKYQQKWQQTPEEFTWEKPELSVVSSPQKGLRLSRQRVPLSLCMIVRDNEHTIRPALESIRPWVDELVVVDTGSVDATPQIVKELGAKLYQFPWCDDFSAARNASLQHATGEWIFWMDSDDTIPAECGEQLRKLALREHDPEVLGYVMQVHCPAKDAPGQVTAVDHVKLIRNRADLRFEGRIHEQVLPSIRRCGGEVAFTDLYVVHSGSDQTPKGRTRKLERDFRILEQDLEERPDHPFVLFNLGMTCADAGKPTEAIEYLQRSLETAGEQDSHLPKTYALLVSAAQQLEQSNQAQQFCDQGLLRFPEDAELLFRSAMLAHQQGSLTQAVEQYRKLLKGTGTTVRQFASLDRGIQGAKAWHNLALVYEDLEQDDQAEQAWRQATASAEATLSAWQGLGESLIRQQKWGEVTQLTNQLSQKSSRQSLGLLLSARACEQTVGAAAASTLLQSATTQHPQATELWQEWGRILFDLQRWEQAKEVLTQLTELESEDASAWQNLGVVCQQLEQPTEAIVAFEQSWQLRPESPHTAWILGQLWQQQGELEKAEAIWQQGLQVHPTDPQLQSAVESLTESALTSRGTAL